MPARHLRLVRLLFWLATAGYWVTLCVLTHLPPQDLPHVGMNDKVEHLLAYGMLAGLIALALWVTFPRRPWLAWGVLVVGLVYGAIDERTQPLYAAWRTDDSRALHQPAADECFLCAAAAVATDEDRRERLVLWQTDYTVVLLNRYPYTNGHLLVAPRAHKPDLDDLGEAEQLD